MKICMVGPSYPFRGGIAHYMTLLYKELKKSHRVSFFSFKRQYPSWLFPGKTDKDVSRTPIMQSQIEPSLDSMNPMTWFQTLSKIKKFNPDLVIFPWWVSFWAPQFWAIAGLVKKFTNAKILFICHNVIPHESGKIGEISAKLVLKKGDYFIVHSNQDMRNLETMLPGANVKKTVHPTYEVFNFKSTDKIAARKKLCLAANARIVLFFGFVRRYKGLRYLLEALPMILKELDIILLIAGEFWHDKSQYLKQIEKLQLKKNVKIIDKYVPNEDVNLYFSACDIVMFPYTSATGSGAIQVAFGLNKPVITTDVGYLSEVVDHNRTGLVTKSKDAQAIARAVLSFYKDNSEDKFLRNISSLKARFSWERTVETISSFDMNRSRS